MSEPPSTGEVGVSQRWFVAFGILWLAETVSILGSMLTGFALGVWVYQRTQSTALLALVNLCGILPAVVLMPLVGVFVDRFNRRTVLIAGDLGAMACTIAMALCWWTDSLPVWLICCMTWLGACCGVTQMIAFQAAVGQIVPHRHLTRANGLNSIAEGVAFVIAPLASMVVYAAVGLGPILLIDVASCCVAVGVVCCVRLPDLVERRPAAGLSVLLQRVKADLKEGWRFLAGAPRLRRLVVLMACLDLLLGLVVVLYQPLALSLGSTVALGVLTAVGGSGLITGSLVLATWGGPRDAAMAVPLFSCFMAGALVVAGVSTNLVVLGGAAFLFFLGDSMAQASNRTAWQRAVPVDMQGRVLSLQGFLCGLCIAVGYLAAGLLVDWWIEPAMQPRGSLAPILGWLIGVGPGRGIALLFLVVGLLNGAFCMWALWSRFLADDPLGCGATAAETIRQ